MDISADLVQLTRSRVAVVSAGAKSILDLGLTMEFLETQCVPLIAYRSDDFPAFYCRSSGLRSPHRLDDPEEVARAIEWHWALGNSGAVLVTSPIPEEDAVDRDEVEAAIAEATAAAEREGVRGKDLTPYLMRAVDRATGGRSARANAAVLVSTAGRPYDLLTWLMLLATLAKGISQSGGAGAGEGVVGMAAGANGMQAAGTRYLQRPGGRVAYDVRGSGPLVVCAPGMGDVRAVHRFLVPRLVEAGYRVATMDLRGHGESDTTFDAYDDVAAGTDLLALADELGGPAVLVGNSMSAGAAVWAAAERPGAVAGLVLIGPFVRDVPVGVLLRLAFRAGLWRPWGRAVWKAYYAKLYPGAKPADLDAHQAAIQASFARPGGWKAFLATTRTSHAPAEARLDQVRAPTLVVMGSADPDFPDPAAEAERLADRLDGEVQLVEGAGHYPQAESPEVVAPRVVAFLRQVFDRA